MGQYFLSYTTPLSPDTKITVEYTNSYSKLQVVAALLVT